MPQNSKENQIQNWRELDTALDSLTISLKPFVKRELRNKFGLNWEDKVSRVAGHQPSLNDPSVLLKTMLAQWWDVFHEILGHNDKNLVGDLMDRRNVSAHRGELSQEDVTHAIGTMIRLLEQIVPLQGSDEIVVNLQQLKSRKQELELQRLEHLLSPRKEKTAKPSRLVLSQHKRQIVNSAESGEAEITDPVVLVRINNSYKTGMTAEELYEAARGDWAIAPDKRSVKPQYAIAVVDFAIVEVYAIDDWSPAEGSSWGLGRWQFDGTIATEKAHFIGKTVRSYINVRSSNPVKYINC